MYYTYYSSSEAWPFSGHVLSPAHNLGSLDGVPLGEKMSFEHVRIAFIVEQLKVHVSLQKLSIIIRN